MDGRLRRFGAWAGLVGPLVFLVLYIIAAAGDPEYVFFDDYLSDLGVGNRAILFNVAVMVAGGLMVPFAILGVRPALDGGIAANAAVAMTLVAAVFLVLVGVFTEDFEGTHYAVSVGFFASMMVALLWYSFTLHYSNALGRTHTELTRTVTAIGIILFIFGFNPRTETVAVLLIVVWGLATAVTLLRRGAEADTY